MLTTHLTSLAEGRQPVASIGGAGAASAGGARHLALGRRRGSANKFTQFAQCKQLLPAATTSRPPGAWLTIRGQSRTKARPDAEKCRGGAPRGAPGRRHRPEVSGN